MNTKISERAHRLLQKLAEQSTYKLAQGYAQGMLDCLRLVEGEEARVVSELRFQEWVEQGEVDDSDRSKLLRIAVDFLGEVD